MLTELCQYLKNWEFDREPEKYYGEFTVSGGAITLNGEALPVVHGQYIRVLGSVFDDGVHLYPDVDMIDETFEGSVWALYIPPAIIALAEEIDAWKAKYEALDSQAMSPFNSESFAGYSYSKSGAGANASANASGVSGWQAVFANRLNPWRKV